MARFGPVLSIHQPETPFTTQRGRSMQHWISLSPGHIHGGPGLETSCLLHPDLSMHVPFTRVFGFPSIVLSQTGGLTQQNAVAPPHSCPGVAIPFKGVLCIATQPDLDLHSPINLFSDTHAFGAKASPSTQQYKLEQEGFEIGTPPFVRHCVELRQLPLLPFVPLQ